VGDRCPCGIFLWFVLWGPGCGVRLLWLYVVFVACIGGVFVE